MRIQDLFEAPLADYQPLGDFNSPGPFRNQLDKKLVTHPAAISKVYKFFENNEFDFRIFVCNISGTGKHAESGAASPEKIKQIFGEEAEKILTNHDDAITIIFVGNSGADRMPLTPWMMAHRLGHAFQANNRIQNNNYSWKYAEETLFENVNKIIREWYVTSNKYYANMNDLYCGLFNAIGTQRSSHTGEINRSYEFMYEIFAQYLQSGKITFRLPPNKIGYGRQAWGKHTQGIYLSKNAPSEEERNDDLDSLADSMNWAFRNVLISNVGKILIM